MERNVPVTEVRKWKFINAVRSVIVSWYSINKYTYLVLPNGALA